MPVAGEKSSYARRKVLELITKRNVERRGEGVMSKIGARLSKSQNKASTDRKRRAEESEESA